jgi:hypothetical protein
VAVTPVSLPLSQNLPLTGEKGRLGFSARRNEKEKISACSSLIFSALASSDFSRERIPGVHLPLWKWQSRGLLGYEILTILCHL